MSALPCRPAEPSAGPAVRRTARWLTLLLVPVVVSTLAGCGPRIGLEVGHDDVQVDVKFGTVNPTTPGTPPPDSATTPSGSPTSDPSSPPEGTAASTASPTTSTTETP